MVRYGMVWYGMVEYSTAAAAASTPSFASTIHECIRVSGLTTPQSPPPPSPTTTTTMIYEKRIIKGIGMVDR
ncbi:hypothetical protein M0804_014414 [Polistes exclamans]|nr:hypothetical protein M0804_014415 [Polistes exclamans]KAI4475267.1 hypothetical protein M0804_014414 [Polistes exclamans]